MEKGLEALGGSGRKYPPFLHLMQMIRLQYASFERLPENVRRCHRVLYSEIDAHAADGRHGMRCIADAKKALAVPTIEPVDCNHKKLDLLPVFEFVEAIRELR